MVVPEVQDASSPKGSGAALFALAFAAATYAASQTLLIPSLPAIEHDLRATPAAAASLISVFLVSGAVATGIIARLGEIYGKRRMIIAVMAVFTCGAVICALATNLPVLVVGRVVMGPALALFPLSYGIIRDTFPRDRVHHAVALIGGLIGGGAALGLVCGGLVADHAGYHWIFRLGVILGTLSTLALITFVPESPRKSGGHIDVIGAVLFAAGLGLPLVALTRVPEWGWHSARTVALAAAGLGILAVFAAHERRHPTPLLDLPTLMLREVRLTNLATFLVGFGLFGASVIIVQYVQVPTSTGYGFGASAFRAALFLIPGCILMLIASQAAGRVSASVGPKRTLVVGAAIGTTALTGLALGHAGGTEIYVWATALYLAMGVVYGAMPSLILEAVPPGLSSQSTAVNIIVRYVGSSIGIQLAATFVSSSVGATGFPTDRGFTHAFILEAAAAFLALVAAFAVPGRLVGASVLFPEQAIETSVQ